MPRFILNAPIPTSNVAINGGKVRAIENAIIPISLVDCFATNEALRKTEKTNAKNNPVPKIPRLEIRNVPKDNDRLLPYPTPRIGC
jgi:hypothetical protein